MANLMTMIRSFAVKIRERIRKKREMSECSREKELRCKKIEMRMRMRKEESEKEGKCDDRFVNT